MHPVVLLVILIWNNIHNCQFIVMQIQFTKQKTMCHIDHRIQVELVFILDELNNEWQCCNWSWLLTSLKFRRMTRLPLGINYALNQYCLGLLLIQRSPASRAVHWGTKHLQAALWEREGSAGRTGNHLVAKERGRVSRQQQQQSGGLLYWDHKVDNQQHTHVYIHTHIIKKHTTWPGSSLQGTCSCYDHGSLPM